MRSLVAVPLKPFSTAKGRLAATLDPDARADLMRMTAGRVIRAATDAGALPVVVTGDDEVATWAHARGIEVLAEPPGGGLDGAATVAAEGAIAAGTPWCVVHGDLPLLEPHHLEAALTAAGEGFTLLAPSRTGGTSLIASDRLVHFSYGPGSFSRHLAGSAGAPLRIMISTGTALDLDTRDDLVAAAGLAGGAWLADYLG
jgi:2-phospho-L-lactate guanylyltransferase